MSLGASLAVCAVLLLRFGMKKLPKVYSYLLWLIVLLRFLCPVTFQTALGLIPVKAEAFTYQGLAGAAPYADTGIRTIDSAVTNTILNYSAPDPIVSANPMQIYIWMGAWLWALTAAALLIYCNNKLCQAKAKNRHGDKDRRRDLRNGQDQNAFSSRYDSAKDICPDRFVGTGERLRRAARKSAPEEKRPLGKAAGIFGSCAALVQFRLPWLSFYLMTKDMEMSVDEAAMRNADEDIRAGYSKSLLSLSMKQNGMLVPLAFGESSTKERVKNVLSFKKPAGWVCAAAVVILIAAAVLLTTSPADTKGAAASDPSSQAAGTGQMDTFYKALCANRTPYIGNNSKTAGSCPGTSHSG